MSHLPDIVIGSGPSGVSVATARLAKGRTVIMLDRGKTLEPAHANQRGALASSAPSQWDAEQIDAYRHGQLNAPDGAIRKFGSDYAVEPPNPATPWLGLRPSLALGGLSNVWGASVLPTAQGDIDDWPINVEDLAPHYAQVAQFMPVSGRQDTIAEVYPGFDMSGLSPLPPTPQAKQILRRADALHGRLGDVVVGAARNAVSGGCVRCGLCLHGCPWGHIWSAAQTVAELQKHPLFTYRNQAMVTGFEQTDTGVTVTLEDGEIVTGARLFVAAGVLETARLFLKSCTGLDRLILRDSQHFFTPLLHGWGVDGDPTALPHHTLTGAFVEFPTPDVGRLVHSQLYTWNEQYEREMMAKYGGKLPFAAPVFGAMSRRLIVAQSFLHSDHSGQIGLRLDASGDMVTAEDLGHDATGAIVKAARNHLARAMRKLGLYALRIAGHSGAPGSSFHVGGSMGMSAVQHKTSTDILGRLQGLSRVHVVDASVLPSIPASTITFTVMANAHRIGLKAD